MNKIKTISFKDGFITPTNYFNTVENEILNKSITPKNVFISLKYLYRYSAIALILSIFIYFENNETLESEIGEYFIDEYLRENSTYDIADQFNLNNVCLEIKISYYELFFIRYFSSSGFQSEPNSDLKYLIRSGSVFCSVFSEKV